MPSLHTRLRDLQRHATLNNVVLAVAVFIALGWVWGAVDALGRNYGYQQQVDADQAANELLSLQTENLQAEQSYLNTNEYLELAARAKLNKALPGEKLLVLPQNQATAAAAAPKTVPKQSNLSQWIAFLSGVRSD